MENNRATKIEALKALINEGVKSFEKKANSNSVRMFSRHDHGCYEQKKGKWVKIPDEEYHRIIEKAAINKTLVTLNIDKS